MTAIRSVAMIGAGAMGCLFAARLAEAGAEVTVIDVDGARLEAIAANGIALTDDGGSRTVAVKAARAEDFDGPADLVILFTKGMHSAAALASVTHLRRFNPVALTLQNGIGNAELLAGAFGADRVLMGTALIPADLTGPSAVETHGFASLQMGAFRDSGGDDVARVADLLARARFAVHPHPRIAVAVWEKLAFNAALNAVGMICEVPNAGIDNVSGRRIATAVVDETAMVAAAKGLAIDRDGVVAQVDAALREHGGHKASMLQDREGGRRSEIETINGAISAEGRRASVPTPVCDTLSDLVRIIEAGY
ncbi:2-dehydropantoate 2-reductase [Sphingomonas sp. LB-2]|uniref:ketopantoate reductase family protein n=1 Tax=Sphingomonas caeni TaxID=2984949 RepID=UPI00222EA4DD|nr:2-dehydropantoate 2-reductase [Sphingomonas caeni]MCW3848591.1 2-dehydropantoate 2-reductase [Sphingomonas caeni]